MNNSEIFFHIYFNSIQLNVFNCLHRVFQQQTYFYLWNQNIKASLSNYHKFEITKFPPCEALSSLSPCVLFIVSLSVSKQLLLFVTFRAVGATKQHLQLFPSNQKYKNNSAECESTTLTRQHTTNTYYTINQVQVNHLKCIKKINIKQTYNAKLCFHSFYFKFFI